MDITQRRLKELYYYNEKLGIFVNKASGKISGSVNGAGYLCAWLDGKSYRVHRLAFLYVKGIFPKQEVDHINGKRADNSFLNLREVSRRENALNQKRAKNNKSGISGVSWNSSVEKWTACIYNRGKGVYLGRFMNLFDACCARKSAELEHGYHINHGRKQ